MIADAPPMDPQASRMSERGTATEPEISGTYSEPDIPVKKRGCPVGSTNGPKPAQAKRVVTLPQPIRCNQVVDPAGPDRP
jgi:hypothetical protein